MALGSRDKSALMTLPQLLRVIDVAWKEGFDDLIRDKALIQEARVIAHLRNTLCHMSAISVEETDRISRRCVIGFVPSRPSSHLLRRLDLLHPDPRRLGPAVIW